MNAYFLSVLLGTVEGLTEFLPLSAPAHLRIAEALMKIPVKDPFWTMYTTVVRMGAALALCMLFLGRIVDLMRTFPAGERRNRTWLTHPISLVLIAFACTAAPAAALRGWSARNFSGTRTMALALVIGGLALWAVDAWSARYEPATREVEETGFFQAVWIGICQTVAAVFPGTSRTLAAITAGEMAGLSRPAAVEFGFLVSIPASIAATAWEFWKEIHAGGAAAHLTMSPERWGVLLIGALVSFIVALGVVEWFLFWVREHGLASFAVYRILLGGWLLIWGARVIGG